MHSFQLEKIKSITKAMMAVYDLRLWLEGMGTQTRDRRISNTIFRGPAFSAGLFLEAVSSSRWGRVLEKQKKMCQKGCMDDEGRRNASFGLFLSSKKISVLNIFFRTRCTWVAYEGCCCTVVLFQMVHGKIASNRDKILKFVLFSSFDIRVQLLNS